MPEQTFNYQKEIEKEWENFQNKKIYPNIAILGQTGCGKSSLINKIFGVDLAKVSDLQPETQNLEMYKGEDYDISVNLIDSRGYELSDTSDSYITSLKRQLNKMKREEKELHIVWFCLSIAKKRIEDIDLNTLKEILKIEELKGRIYCVLTKCDEDTENADVATEYKKILKENINYNLKIYEVSLDENLKLDLDQLIRNSIMSLDSDDLRNHFVSSLKGNLKLKRETAESCITKYMVLAGGIGASPIPFSDSILLAPLQSKMIVEITNIYGLKNKENLSKGFIIELIAANVGKSLAGSLLKLIPGIGTIAGGLINASVATAITYAIGKVISELCYRNCEAILQGNKENILKIFDTELIKQMVNKFFRQYMEQKN